MSTALVITVSDRSHAGLRPDASGPLAVELLTALGLETSLTLVPDGVEPVADALRRAADTGVDLVLTSGGTGIGPRDLTPEATRSVIEREAPGIAELVRAQGLAKSPHAALSRGIAGTIGHTLVVNLPGSPKAVAEGIEVLAPLIPHALTQLAGGDH